MLGADDKKGMIGGWEFSQIRQSSVPPQIIIMVGPVQRGQFSLTPWKKLIGN